jgi:NitT/TauT family transport system permease protein
MKTQSRVHFIFYIIGCLCGLLLWWLVSHSAYSPLYRFNPLSTCSALLALFANGRFWQGLWETLVRLLGGLSIAAFVGIPLGLLTGYFSAARQLTYIPFQFLRMISPLSWTPVAIILFGIGSAPVYFLVSIAAVWPIMINTATGVISADKEWLELARCLGANDWQTLRHIVVRATLPSILVGLQLALGVAWIVIIPAEMLGVASGLGYMILDFRDVNDYASIMALIIVIGILGLCLDLPLRHFSKRLQVKPG